MGDRCAYVQIRFPGNKIKTVARLLNLPYYETEDEIPEGDLSRYGDDSIYLERKGDGCAELHDMNGGGCSATDALKDAGIPFEGYNTDGCEYPECLWAYMGDDEDPSMIDVASYEGSPLAIIGPNLKPSESDLDLIGDYYRILEKVKSYMETNRAVS